jgi:hypothetical protein
MIKKSAPHPASPRSTRERRKKEKPLTLALSPEYRGEGK